MNPLLQPYDLSGLTLKNRLVMAPLTRRRAAPGGVPTALMAEYYRQRATAGLIVAEATPISPTAIGYMDVPGIYIREQVEGWKQVTRAVHQAGGIIFLQLWHVGRYSHSSLQPGGMLPVAPSAISAGGLITTPTGKQPLETPHALTLDGIKAIIADYRMAARNALEAGFDGVEIHGANSYLLDQFMHASSNLRTDKYGGSIENRCRLTLEVTDAVVAEVGADKTGIRLSPSVIKNGMDDPDPAALFEYVISELSHRNLMYLHLVEPLGDMSGYPHMVKDVARHFRPFYRGTLISCGEHTRELGMQLLEEGAADLVGYGRLFIANPDLPARFEKNAPLNVPNPDTFYTPGPAGYTDYPFLG